MGRIKDSKLTHKKMLFLGDFESSYDILLSAYVNEIRDHDIVMIPHHGAASNGNPNKNFYELVKPTYAIVSAEIDSNNKHPKWRPCKQYVVHPLKLLNQG